MFHFGGKVPSPEVISGRRAFPRFPEPTQDEGKGLAARDIPDVKGAKAQWITQLDHLARADGADSSLLEEVRGWILHGVKSVFKGAPPVSRRMQNSGVFQKNLPLCMERLKVYRDYRALRALSGLPPPGAHIQPLHAVIKPGKKARICVDLSRNFNDFVEDQKFRMSSVQSAVDLAQEAGGSPHFVKLDLSACFLSFPIHEDDLRFFYCEAGGDFFQFVTLVFGRKDAPRAATLLLDVVSASLSDQGIAHVRYLDDFFLVGSSSYRVWACAHRAAKVIADFGLSLSLPKVEGPSQRMEFLGIVIDSRKKTLSISTERHKELMGLLQAFGKRRTSSVTRLQSLLGKLSFAATVLPGARPFLRRIIDSISDTGRGKFHVSARRRLQGGCSILAGPPGRLERQATVAPPVDPAVCGRLGRIDVGLRVRHGAASPGGDMASRRGARSSPYGGMVSGQGRCDAPAAQRKYSVGRIFLYAGGGGRVWPQVQEQPCSVRHRQRGGRGGHQPAAHTRTSRGGLTPRLIRHGPSLQREFCGSSPRRGQQRVDGLGFPPSFTPLHEHDLGSVREGVGARAGAHGLAPSAHTHILHTPQQPLRRCSPEQLNRREVEYRWMVKLTRSMDLAVSSQKTYASSQRKFLGFCEAFGIVPLAISEDELCQAVVDFALTRSSGSLDAYMSAIQKLYTLAGAGSLPRGPGYLLCRRGVKRLFGASDEPIRTRALGVSELRQLLESIDRTDPGEVCLGAQLVVAFFLALRTEDHTDGRLRLGDIRPKTDGSVEFLLPPGKSSGRFRLTAIAAKLGVLNALMWLRLHVANIPVRERGANKPVFVVFKPGGRIVTKSRATFVAELKLKVASVLHCDPALYAGYSLRRGGVTEMLSAGVPLAIINAHVGWAPGSNAHCTYYDHSGRLQMRIATRAMGGAFRT